MFLESLACFLLVFEEVELFQLLGHFSLYSTPAKTVFAFSTFGQGVGKFDCIAIANKVKVFLSRSPVQCLARL
jgi:hypothetical protein